MNLVPLRLQLMSPQEVEACHADYACFLDEIGYTLEEVQSVTFREDDLERINMESLGLRLSASPIGGLGVFAVGSIEPRQVIGLARSRNRRSQIGRYLNHSPYPNATFRALPNGDIEAVALRKIEREEITVDYRTALTMPGTRQPKRRTA